MQLNKQNLTAEEEKLLSGIYIDKTRITAAKLHDYQQHALALLRQGKAYLTKKYPEAVFAFELFTPASNDTPYSTILFSIKEGSDVHYTLQISETDTGILFEDNYYGEFIRHAYDAHIKGILNDELGIDAEVKTVFPYPKAGIDAGITLSALLSMKEHPGCNVDLYVNDMPDETTSLKIREAMEKRHLYGFYTIHYRTDQTGKTAIDDRDSIQVFRCFMPDVKR